MFDHNRVSRVPQCQHQSNAEDHHLEKGVNRQKDDLRSGYARRDGQCRGDKCVVDSDHAGDEEPTGELEGVQRQGKAVLAGHFYGRGERGAGERKRGMDGNCGGRLGKLCTCWFVAR